MIIRKPLYTEKTMALAEKGIFAFAVDPKATKHQIKAAVEAQFGVDVIAIRTVKMASRKVASRRTRHYISVPAKKKAFVTLKPKQTIDLFEIKK